MASGLDVWAGSVGYMGWVALCWCILGFRAGLLCSVGWAGLLGSDGLVFWATLGWASGL